LLKLNCQAVQRIKDKTFILAEVQNQHGIDIRPEEAVLNLKTGLVEVVYEWARGMPFKDITTLTDVLEGIEFD
jgi:antiviral helicase SKI2